MSLEIQWELLERNKHLNEVKCSKEAEQDPLA